eukprot:366558-Chlamydomonas_euryale.AAC.16
MQLTGRCATQAWRCASDGVCQLHGTSSRTVWLHARVHDPWKSQVRRRLALAAPAGRRVQYSAWPRTQSKRT